MANGGGRQLVAEDIGNSEWRRESGKIGKYDPLAVWMTLGLEHEYMAVGIATRSLD